MEELYLVKPTRDMRKEAMDYRQEYIDYGEGHINGSGGFSHYDNYDVWLDMILSIEKDSLTKEKVHASTYFSVRKSDGKIIGTIQLRHSLSEELRRYGGHIGYSIRPSERRKSYGAKQLALVLEEAKKLGLSEVMITCDKENIGSARTAIKNGGTLESEDFYEPTKEVLQIYWISLNN